MIGFILDYWPVILWVAAVAAAYIYGGWKIAAVVATLGLAGIAYRKGRRDATQRHRQVADELDKRRREEYDKIDQRGTTGSDAADRLRKGDY